MTFALDASVLLAIIGDEPGADRALELGRSGALSWVNAGEVYTKVTDRGGRVEDAALLLRHLDLRLHGFEEADAIAVAELLPLTRHVGLSFGDRACLALGQRLGLSVLTAERQWAEVKLRVPVELLR